MLKCPYLKHLSLQLFKIRGHPLKRIFHIRTSSILIVSVEHYFLFLRLFSFFLVATCVSLFIGKQTIDNLFFHLKGNPNGLNFFITTMRKISKCAMFYLSTFSIALSQQHPFIGFLAFCQDLTVKNIVATKLRLK